MSERSTAIWHVGNTRQVLATLPDASVDLVLTSPPFLQLRSYLAGDDPNKAAEMGGEATPGAFIDGLLDIVVECRRVLAPHGSLCVELGDTYGGSGGAGGDYLDDGLRSGAPKFGGSAKASRTRHNGNGEPDRQSRSGRGDGWPLNKSLCMIPESFRWALTYGRNPFTGRTIEPWRVRNVVRWCRPNPPVGKLADKFRPATSDLAIACVGAGRYFDLDAVRVPLADSPGNRYVRRVSDGDRRGRLDATAGIDRETNKITSDYDPAESGGAPPLDWWDPVEVILTNAVKAGLSTPREWAKALRDAGILDEGDAWRIATQPYRGSHYATWPEQLCVTPIEAMCPRRVCTVCGLPSVRLVESKSTGQNTRKVGWSDCGHDAWRAGVVLDPFAGSGTTGAVAVGRGRSFVGIDLDERNAWLARERIGMWLDVAPVAPVTVVPADPGVV